MKANQKYFPLLDSSGKLTNKFLIVSNISRRMQSGNRRQRARGAPASGRCEIFLRSGSQEDAGIPCAWACQGGLPQQARHAGRARTTVCAIAKAIGQQLGGDALAMQAEQAALLAKADLLTDMVGEFPELQGIMDAITRSTMASPTTSRSRSKTTTSRVFPVTSCRAIRSVFVLRWRTSWRHWSACSASARSDRRQRSVRVTPSCARRDPHPD